MVTIANGASNNYGREIKTTMMGGNESEMTEVAKLVNHRHQQDNRMERLTQEASVLNESYIPFND